jgi:hypothetical protein
LLADASTSLFFARKKTISSNRKMRKGLLLILGNVLVLGVLAWNGAGNPVRKCALHRDLKRRELLSGIFLAGLTQTPLPTYAASPIDAGEAIRRGAANIPGYGPTDVFFPSSLIGSWKMTREVDFGGGSQPLILTYPFRFLQSIEDNAVVMDRGVNQAELEKALIRAVAGKEDGASLQSYEWAYTNPNDLRLVLPNGLQKEIKVTKRATERGDGFVSSSEFQRVTQEDVRGIYNISARRVLNKWKLVDGNTIEGLEIVYSMGGGDPMAAGSGSAQPAVLSKSRLYLKR